MFGVICAAVTSQTNLFTAVVKRKYSLQKHVTNHQSYTLCNWFKFVVRSLSCHFFVLLTNSLKLNKI